MINGDLFNKKLLPLVAFKQVQSTVRIQIQGLWIFLLAILAMNIYTSKNKDVWGAFRSENYQNE